VTALAVARLLVRFRWRSLWNGAWRVPQRKSLRVAWVLLVLVPVAYVGLFATAFGVIADMAPLADQAAVLAVVASAIALASVAAKMATSDAVVGGSGENEFLLTRPIPLPTLVMARSFAGVATNLFDALFLFPVLVSASLVWDLGVDGVLLSALISVIVQIGISAAAQAGQMVMVRLVAPARRRTVWSALALLAALTMACLWMVASWVLRRPELLVDSVRPWTTAFRLSPGGWIVEPLAALARGWGGSALLALAAPLELTVLALVLASAAVRWAGRAGWEQAGLPWAEASRGPSRRGARMTPFTKDWYLIVRDRSRLVTLVAVPVIFIGIQVFGSVGWSWTAGEPRHIAVVAYSLAAYMAGLGPLAHMDAERRSFWLLRVAPVPLGRLLAWKAAFWATIVGGTAALVAFGLLLAGGPALTADALGTAALAVLGAVTASSLAVAMASGAADFSDENRRAIGPGTLYLFLLVAGLFNVALLEGGEVRVRALVLYLAAVALHWSSGVEQSATVFDPGSRGDRRIIASDGATLAIVLFLGSRAQRLASALDEPWLGALWPGLVAVGAAIYLLRRPGRETGWSLLPALGVGLVVGALASVPGWTGGPHPPALLLGVTLVRAIAEELIFRGIVQRGLAPRGRWLAYAIAAVMALVAGARPFGPAALLVAAAPSLALALTGRWASAGAARLLLELFL
jgi:membrane protease YdiL (CAAX protease family)